MRKQLFIGILMVLGAALTVSAVEFKPYPGARLDEKATREARELAQASKSKSTATIYTTSDSFQAVTSFYKGIAREFSMPRSSGTSGKPKQYDQYELWEAYFLLDDAKDLAESKLWIKVQRPYIGEKVVDVTAIVVSEKK